jgi:hypothetical protein
VGLLSQRCNQPAMSGRETIRRQDEAAPWLSSQHGDNGFDVGVAANGGGDGRYSERSSCSLKGRHVISCSGRIRAEHDCGSLDARCNLVQQFQPLAAHSSFDVDKSGKISVDIYRHAASYVDRILRGTKPAELPVQVPVKFEMIVNAKTATALGLRLPQSILLRADEVIE